MKANKRTEDSCYESDEQHSSKQNLDLNINKYQRELQKRIRKKKNTSSCNKSDKQR